MPLPLDASVDLSFLDSPTALDVQRRDFLAGAIHYARWACRLTDEVLCAPDKPKPMEPKPKRNAAMRHLPVLPTGQGHEADWAARGGQGCRGCQWPARPPW